ncbi:MAG: hypothetical protein U5L08_09625 [Xanthomonadales bacterium]|nr:hypothetical protein [Xanthomonadales bacterium]
MGSFSLGFGVAIVYLVMVVMMFVLAGVLIRLLWVLTRLANRKAELLKIEAERATDGPSGSQGVGDQG